MAAVSQAGLMRERCGRATGPGRCPCRSGCGPRRGRGRGGGRRGRACCRCGCRWRSGVAPAVALFDQRQLRAGMRAFPAHDDPHSRPGRPASARAGSSPVSSATPASSDGGRRGVERRGPVAVCGSALIAVRSRSVMVQPTENCSSPPGSRSARMWARNSWVPPAPSERIRIVAVPVGVGDLGQRRVEHRDVVGGGVASPALPGRSRTASDSPVLSHARESAGGNPKVPLNVPARLLLVELAQVRAKVCKVAPAAPGLVRAGWRVGAGVGRGRRCRRRSGPDRCCSCRARLRRAWGRGR